MRAFFESEGLTGPTFFDGELKQALAKSKKDLKFILLYIHRVGHPDADRLCRETLASTPVAEFLNDNLIFWGETSKSREGRGLALQLQRINRATATHPFFALVCLKNHQMQIIWTQFGFIAPEDLLSNLAIQMEQNQQALVDEQDARDQSVINQSIREEQDAAYEVRTTLVVLPFFLFLLLFYFSFRFLEGEGKGGESVRERVCRGGGLLSFSFFLFFLFLPFY